MRINRCYRRRTSSRKLLLFTLLFWALAGFTSLTLLNWGGGTEGQDLRQEVGKQYLTAAFPVISRSAGTDLRESAQTENILKADGLTGRNTGQGVINDDDDMPINTGVVDSASVGNPLVLIYHTHATESYQPVSDGNFHSQSEAGTVREVGNVLETALKAKGISVIHNKTLHDNPSYNQSYSRSVETAKSLLKANPSIKIVIDLHRDAASYSGNKAHTFNSGGKTAAQFCLVVGKGNDNVEQLMAFANKVNQKANALYPGFSRGIIQKEYKYNQYIADNYLLLEMGNNENNIEEVKLSAVLFADAIAEVLKDM